MRIGGVDCGGSKIAVAILDGDDLHVHRFQSSTANRGMALRSLAAFGAQFLNYCDLVYVEEPVVGRGVRASLQVCQTAGAVMSHLSVPSYFVPVSSWKKEVIGRGNAPKGLVGTSLRELHPRYSQLCGGDQDLIDATCIALYGASRQHVVERLSAHY